MGKKINIIASSELRKQLSYYLGLVEAGETIYIMRRGIVTAYIEPTDNNVQKKPTPEMSEYLNVETEIGTVIFRKWERRDEQRVIAIMHSEQVKEPVNPFALVLPEQVFSLFIVGESEAGHIIAFGALSRERNEPCNIWIQNNIIQSNVRSVLLQILSDAAITT